MMTGKGSSSRRTRREFLRKAVKKTMLLPVAGIAVTKNSYTSLSAGKVHVPVVRIYEGHYPAWPWITSGRDGTFYCVFREGTVHMYSAGGRIMFTISRDRGKHWTRAKVIIDVPKVDDRNTAIVELPDRTLLVIYNSFTASGKSVAMMTRSRDGGNSWSTPCPVDRSNTRTRSAPIVLGNGDILLPYYVAPANGALAARSSDNGKTWTTVSIPNAKGFVGDEWDILEVSPGRVIGILRNSYRGQKNSFYKSGLFWKTESRDYGKTWSVPKPTNVQSKRYPSPAQITRHNRKPLLVYDDRRMVSVSAVTSSDPEFLEWNLSKRIPCYQYNADGRPIRDGGYPVSVQVDSRTRLIVDYEIRNTVKRIVGHFVTIP